jgi:hypothetical protein
MTRPMTEKCNADLPGRVTGTTKETEGTMSVRLDSTRRAPRLRGLLGRRSLRLWLVLVVAIAAVSFVGATAPVSSHSATAGASTPCADDGNGGCLVTLPCPVGQTTDCPTIDVAPNTNMNDGQYVYITATNFDPTGSIRVAVCSAVGSTTDPSCLSGVWEGQYLLPTAVPVTANPSTKNLTSLSYPVFADPAGQGNNQIPARDLVNTVGAVPNFNCDNASSPCEVVVTYEPGQGNNTGNGPTITATNSAVVPITFATAAAGCPTSDPQVQVDSAFSLEHFIPSAVEATCAQSNGVVALNTANDDASVINDFVTPGGSTISFVDNASDPSQLAALLGRSYAYIPVALSGTTESFLAGASNQGQNFPINRYKLTPNMVAGLITSLYQVPIGNYSQPPKPKYTLADNLVSALAAANPPVTCAVLTGCPATKAKFKQFLYMQKYDAFDLLNPVPSGDYGPATFGSFNSNVASGSSFQATSWLCHAPNTPFTVPVDEVGHSAPVDVTVTDPNVSGSTLTTAPNGSSIWPPYPNASWVYPDCHGYSAFPALSATANNYGPAQSPAFQAKAMRNWCFGGTVLPQPPSPQNPCAAFGLMDTSEAQFYGLSSASIENASGNFVAPTVASLEAAASGFTPCPAADLSCPSGTYRSNYGDTNPAAYPMANITYAVVPTSTLSHDKGTAVKNLLTNLVTFSHSGAVPAGYAPLPDSIYTAALAAISTDISVEAAPPTTTTTTTTTATTSAPVSSAGGSSNSADPSGQDTSSLSTTSPTSQLPLSASDPPAANPNGSPTTPVAAPPASIPTSFLLVGLSATTRFLLPAIAVLALGSLLGGLLMLFGPGVSTRRRRNEAGGPS